MNPLRTFFRLLVPVVVAICLLGGPATGAVTITPFPPDGAAVLVVADGWAYIVRVNPPIAVAAWKLGDTQPDPPIPPIPRQVSGVWIIEEQADRTAAQAKIMDDPVWQAALLAKGLTYGIADDDGKRVEPMLPAIAKAELALPVVCFTDEYGAVVKVQALPATVEEMRAVIGGLK